MAQSPDFVVDDGDGTLLLSQLNAMLPALASSNSGPTAPLNPYPGMPWFDTSVSPEVFRRRNAANTDWDVVSPGYGLSTRTELLAGTSGTYNTPTDCFLLWERAVGGGGGGGGVFGSATGSGVGGGGQAGSFAELIILNPSASFSYSVGSGGAGGVPNGNGSGGGNTTFSDGGSVNISAEGGAGGEGMIAGTGFDQALGGSGQTASGGDININGQVGSTGIITNGVLSNGGDGGSSPFGFGGRMRGANSNGSNGQGFGAGGGGALTITNATSRTGGAGSGGRIEIWEFY